MVLFELHIAPVVEIGGREVNSSATVQLALNSVATSRVANISVTKGLAARTSGISLIFLISWDYCGDLQRESTQKIREHTGLRGYLQERWLVI